MKTIEKLKKIIKTYQEMAKELIKLVNDTESASKILNEYKERFEKIFEEN